MTTTDQELRGIFEERFGRTPVLAVTSPGRTEIAGNHTDHEGGHVIAAAVDRAVHGLAAPNGTDAIRLLSLGFGEVEIPIGETADLAPRDDERATTAALVRGMAALFAERGHTPAGFDLACASEVLGGSGLSSSAAFELTLAQVMNALWASGECPAGDAAALAPMSTASTTSHAPAAGLATCKRDTASLTTGPLAADELALMSQRVEREWFGKPCGLMDQAAVALGGIQAMDFSTPGVLAARAIDFDFAEVGHALCIVAVGADHAANTDDYAAVPAEMQAAARELGAGLLSEVTEADVLAALPRIRAALGDRAALRAIHYFREERLVAARAEALAAHDMDAFLAATRASGASSAMYLQNVSVGGAESQPSMLAIALAEELLAGEGAVRVHGGGFGGTIQAFVPEARVDAFRAGMDAVFGEGACGIYRIDHEGARYQWL